MNRTNSIPRGITTGKWSNSFETRDLPPCPPALYRYDINFARFASSSYCWRPLLVSPPCFLPSRCRGSRCYPCYGTDNRWWNKFGALVTFVTFVAYCMQSRTRSDNVLYFVSYFSLILWSKKKLYVSLDIIYNFEIGIDFCRIIVSILHFLSSRRGKWENNHSRKVLRTNCTFLWILCTILK